MGQGQIILVFRSVPKKIYEYIKIRNKMQETPIRAYTTAEGDYDLSIEVQKDKVGVKREYIYGLIDGYLLANQPE